jgi:uroporphyrinogen-III synthase
VAATVKVLLTRAVEQVGDLTARIAALGCEVIEIPLIAIADPADGGAALDAALLRAASPGNPYKWVVLTSPNAAHRALSRLSGTTIGRTLGPASGRPKIAAIGAGTAAVCRELGFDVDLVPERAVGEGLVAAFPDADADQDARKAPMVLLPRAESARDVVPDGLRAKGWGVEVVSAYRTVPRAPDPLQCRTARGADLAVLTSSSTARALVAALGAPLPMRVVSIGPQTTATLEDLGVTVHATAEPHTLDGVVRAVARILSGSP